MDYLIGSISTQLISSTALTLIHFIWQAAVVALVLKLLLTIIPQKYLQIRYKIAVLALAAIVALPGFTLYILVQSPDLVQSTIDYSSKAVVFIEPIPDAQSVTPQSSITESSEQLAGITALSSFIENGNKLLLNLLIIWMVGCFLIF